MEYVYHCKKNGRDYVYTTDVEFAQPQDAYAWRRGVREYADNYHASVTRKGWTGTDDEFAIEVSNLCDEAAHRFHSGDVPGERTSDPKATQARKQAAAILAASPEIQAQIAALLAAQTPAAEPQEPSPKKARKMEKAA